MVVDINILYVKILELLSSGSGNQSSIAREFHVSKQAINKRVKALEKRGLVMKVGRGKYVLTPEGKAYLENIKRLGVETGFDVIDLIEKAVDKVIELRRKGVESDLEAHLIDYAVSILITHTILYAVEASKLIKKPNIVKELNKFWEKELRLITLGFIEVLFALSDKGWDRLRQFFNALKQYGLFHATILDEELIRSQRSEDN